MAPIVRPTLLASVVTVSDVTVVGAGLAGLACARILAAAGVSVTVLESSDGVGGRVRSDLVDGWTLDRGFQILLTAYPELSRWYDLDALDLRAFTPGATIWCGDRFRSIGDPRRSPRDLPATAFGPIGTPLDRLRLLRLLVSVRRGAASDLLRRPDRSTAAELRARGFSDRFVERFLQPLFSGIQLDPDLEVSSRRFEMILRMLAVGESGVPAAGMGILSALLAGGLADGVVRLETPVVTVDGTAVHCASGDRVTADAVVVATDGPTASRLVGTPDPGSRPVAAVWFDTSNAPLEDRRILLDGARSGPVANLA
ncbi:MAG: FAD-dependent oxidoreductase, partial [Acidimicrobiia bacterium]|nr:FAD-dependent oxidoreductase [Acidimicrobiia bacterium]